RCPLWRGPRREISIRRQFADEDTQLTNRRTAPEPIGRRLQIRSNDLPRLARDQLTRKSRLGIELAALPPAAPGRGDVAQKRPQARVEVEGVVRRKLDLANECRLSRLGR